MSSRTLRLYNIQWKTIIVARTWFYDLVAKYLACDVSLNHTLKGWIFIFNRGHSRKLCLEISCSTPDFCIIFTKIVFVNIMQHAWFLHACGPTIRSRVWPCEGELTAWTRMFACWLSVCEFCWWFPCNQMVGDTLWSVCVCGNSLRSTRIGLDFFSRDVHVDDYQHFRDSVYIHCFRTHTSTTQ